MKSKLKSVLVRLVCNIENLSVTKSNRYPVSSSAHLVVATVIFVDK